MGKRMMDSGKRKGLRDREAGVTLVEVILVVTIIGILAAVITLSSVGSKAHWDLVTAARILVSNIRETRDDALTLGTGAEVYFYKDRGFYERRIGPEVYETVYLPAGIEFTRLTFPEHTVYAGVYYLHFARSGNPSQTGTVYLKSSTGEYRAVKVAVGTGRVRLTNEAPP